MYHNFFDVSDIFCDSGSDSDSESEVYVIKRRQNKTVHLVLDNSESDRSHDDSDDI